MAERRQPTKYEARQARRHKVAQLQSIVYACECLWPLVVMRNRHGHDSDCPAIEVWEHYRLAEEEPGGR